MKRILMLNYEFPPLGGGAGNANYYLLKEFGKGSDVRIGIINDTINDTINTTQKKILIKIKNNSNYTYDELAKKLKHIQKDNY